MERFTIKGGNKLYGRVDVRAAKNSVLPLIAASILSEGKTYIKNCPKIRDVFVMAEIIERIGGRTYFDGDVLVIDTEDVCDWKLPQDLTSKIRASLFTVGALVSRFGKAAMYSPGGCNIGDRPIDIHIQAMRALGVTATEGEYIAFKAVKPVGADITLRFPSVGATENAMMTAVKCKGVTRIKNCAREPEIVDLAKYLNLIGAKIKGAGSEEIEIEGVDKLGVKEVEITPSYDRIEAGTFLLAGASCGGELEFLCPTLANSLNITEIVGQNACKICAKNDKIYTVEFNSRPKGFGKIATGPFPAFVTDLQPQLVACACVADGITVVEERVFPERFGYVKELVKTGADAQVFANACVITGKERLTGATLEAADLRGGAALVIAALAAEGESVVCGVGHIDRGYEKLDEKLKSLGAKIERIRV